MSSKLAPVVRATAVGATALLVGTLGACSTDRPPAPTAAVTAAPTPIERLNTEVMRLRSGPFCTRVPSAAVRDALDGADTGTLRRTAWGDGDRADLEPGDLPSLADVAHETGCRWSRGEDSAAAWTFVGTVSPDVAQQLVADAGRRNGCRTSPADFGSPGLRQACHLGDGTRRVRVAGLVAGTWLTCEIVAAEGSSATAVRARAEAWAVSVANALNTTR